MSDEILSIKNLSFRYGEAPEALSRVCFSVRSGESIAIAGPNGAGKSTLIRLALGLIESRYEGEIALFGTLLQEFREFRKIGYLPQRVNVFNPLFPATVSEVVGLGLLSGKLYPKRQTASDRDRIRKTLQRLDILDLEHRSIGELSGGQQQRVFLARAVVGDPDILFLDEPSTALDPEARDRFYGFLDVLRIEKGTAIVIITHDIAHAGEHAEKLLFLDRSVIFFGPFADFCESKEMEGRFGFFAQHMICHQHRT
ncbi:MAG: metal ABC transporter ATP-binding protein [Candidatus Moranbacteria bacterium]|nr:metal ABC transporter ATP-binding protein [Candidatus Moranbacteria bacterium]NTW75756.1 metal ABC transporter ATP-binding protein [Candidatus Moranbacteria bacterium]